VLLTETGATGFHLARAPFVHKFISAFPFSSNFLSLPFMSIFAQSFASDMDLIDIEEM
jgi:hypothetical protein